MKRYIFDTECYIDYFLLMLRDIDTEQVFSAEMYPGKELGINQLPEGLYIGFNSKNYDLPILSLALAGCDNQTLKRASDSIIVGKLKPWDIEREFGGIDLRGLDHIDIMEVAPGQCGLKAYGGRLHSSKLQDLPIDPSANISESDRALLREYCANDLQTTLDLHNKVLPQIELRVKMGNQYGIDLRSKSDAQIAEAVIKSEVEKITGGKIYRPELSPDFKFKYKPPKFINFQTEGMNWVLNVIRNAEFGIDDTGAVITPIQLQDLRVNIGKGQYRMGSGGLHSCENSVSYVEPLIDRDVASYYPSLILTNEWYPSQMGEAFLQVYKSILDRRLIAKQTGDKVTNEALKIVVNGSFGKFGSKWSSLYSPELLIQVTLTGQLALLMLIELLETYGVEVVSANTDGVVMKAHPAIDWIVTLWELTTGLTTEETKYRALHSRDVNNYIAIKDDGAVKLKGAYALDSISKNPTNVVCVDAVVNYLRDGISPHVTVSCCRDITKFVTIRKVTGGGEKNGKYLGKIVRWYYGEGEVSYINYFGKTNKVPKSDGAIPIMQFGLFPNDIDYLWYIREAQSILKDLGVSL